MRRPGRGDASADLAYLHPLVVRLGAEEVHRLVDLIAHQLHEGPPEDAGDDG